MKKVLIAMLMLMPMLANAETVEIDGIYYNLITKAKIAEVTSNPNDYTGKVSIPETVTYNDVKYDVTSIGYGAFGGCSNLTSIIIPNSVTSIGNSAFYHCIKLTSITIPNSVTSIGSKAFMYCIGLMSVIIPNSMTSIGESAFEKCNSLAEVHISDLAAWCNIKFDFYSNPLSYAQHLYMNGEEVKDLIIPNTVTCIGDFAFQGCTCLTSITIPNSVTCLGGSAFSGCSSLTSITIPNSVTNIGEFVFANCSGLTSIAIPNSVTCLGGGAFYNCRNLTNVNIPNSVANIGYETFHGCSGLTNIIIPNSVANIGNQAFYGCSGLTTVIIPNSMSNIGDGAFSGCSELTDVYCYVEVVPFTASNAFKNSYIEYATLHVPATSIEAYKEAEPWKNFKNIIELVNPSGIQGIKVDKDGNTLVYDLNGRRLTEPVRGINIIGSKKVIVK